MEFVQLLQDMLGDLEGNPEPIEVKIFGDDLPTLARLAEQVAQRMKQIDGVVDVVAPQRGNPELDLRIDPTRAAKAGFTVDAGVRAQLATGLLGNVATAFRRGDRLDRRPGAVPRRYRFDYDWVREFPLTNSAGVDRAAVGHRGAVDRRGRDRSCTART